MKLQPVKFGIAWAASGAVFSLIIGVFMFAMPARPNYMDQHMMRSPMGNWDGAVGFGGIFAGLILWSALAGLFGGLIAFIYNALVKGKTGEN